MTRYTKKNQRGGDKLQDIQTQLNTIQEELNELKNSEPIFAPVAEPVSEPLVEPVSELVSESVIEPVSELVVSEPVVDAASEPVISEPIPEPEPEPVVDIVSEPISKPISKKPISKPWVTNKEIKFKDGEGGRVLLAFSRVISHIDNNIKKGSTTKDWKTIKEKLMVANSENEVQDIINEYKVKFASNYVLGGKTKKKGKRNKRKTHKRR
jgi:hypothetical protein